MRRLFSLLGLLLLSYAPSLLACEGCKEPSNVAGDSGVAGISASFSWSVLFMICMLGILMSCLLVMMIRSCKQLAQQQQASQTCRFASSSSTRANQTGSPTALSLNGFGSPAI
jgi:Na+/melibiose symporter-like transporter